MKTEARPLRPEEDLLLCCARARMDPERAERIRVLLAEDLDWDYLLRVAHPHGMSAFLHRHLEAIESGLVPDTVRQQLHEQVVWDARQNLRLAGELRVILADLESHGISVIPLKGPVLATAIYGDLALRPFRDLDLLVHKEDVPRATALLVNRGYRRQNEIPATMEAAFIRAECQWTLENKTNGVLVDLHWVLAPLRFVCRIDLGLWWSRAEPVTFGDRRVLGLTNEDALLMLCVHGAKHCWGHLKWICDVAELIKRENAMDWAYVTRQANASGATRILVLGLLLASELVGAEVPQEMLQRARAESAAGPLATQVRNRLFRGGQSGWGLEEATRFHFRTKEGWRDKVCYAIRMATPRSTDWAAWPLPATFAWLYYLIRPVRLLVKCGGKTAHRLVSRFPLVSQLTQQPNQTP